MPLQKTSTRALINLSDRTWVGQTNICAIKAHDVSKGPISSIEPAELVTLWHGGCKAVPWSDPTRIRALAERW